MGPRGRLARLVAFLCLPAAIHPEANVEFDPAYDRRIECTKGVNLSINDRAKAVVVMCNETQFDVSLLRKCSDYAQFKQISLMNCILPSSDVGEVLGDYRPDCVFVYSNKSWNYNEIIVRNLPNLVCLALSIKQNVTYVLDNLINLSSLQVVFMNLTFLPENFFSQLDSLVNVHVEYSEVEFLPENTFRGLRNIVDLFLCCNRLRELSERLFDGLAGLQTLDLSLNRLTRLPDNIFRSLTDLKKLTLGGNRLAQLPAALLHQNPNLNLIDLGNNSIVSLPEEFLRSSVALQTFSACNCNLTELPETFFSASPSLKMIFLCNNEIRRLRPGSFSNNRWLQVLYLNHNRLTALPSPIFTSNRRLEGLFLQGNLLDSFAPKTFRTLSFLKTLSLYDNRMEKIQEEVFGHLPSLLVLNLDQNRIDLVPPKTPLTQSRRLLSLSLAGNNLTAFPLIEWSAHNLTFLNLDYNRIKLLDLRELPPSGRVYISLRHNNITSVSVPENFVLTADLRLENNPLECDCSLKNFVELIRKSPGAKSLFCHGPREFGSKNLRDVTPSYLLCPLDAGCPPSCRCYREGDGAVVNCSSSNLIRLPKSLPENASVVLLDHNFVTVPRLTKNWSQVVYLDLDYNRLDPSKSWKLPPSLEYLSVRSNQLDRLSPQFLARVERMPRLRLNVRDNRFWCNCSFTYLKLWLDKNLDRLVEGDKVACSRWFRRNDSATRSPMADVPLDAFCPVDVPVVNAVLIVSASAAAVLALSLVGCIVLLAKHKNTVSAYLYVHFPAVSRGKRVVDDEADDGKLYDAFVSYTGSDRRLALAMLKELEEKPPFFKLCLHERDWLPGNAIVSQIEASVRSSRKTVIVLSKEFLESVWCEMEFQMAYLQCLEDKANRLIVVTVGEAPARNLLPADMRHLLATETFLVWGERWFWEKLRYSLPHHPLPKLPSYQLRTVDGMIEDLRDKRLI